jgi:hypothetical protein
VSRGGGVENGELMATRCTPIIVDGCATGIMQSLETLPVKVKVVKLMRISIWKSARAVECLGVTIEPKGGTRMMNMTVRLLL